MTRPKKADEEPPENAEALRALLVDLRRRRGLSQRDVARIARTAQPTVSRWERPGGPLPDLAQAAAILETLAGIDLPGLLTVLAGDKPPRV